MNRISGKVLLKESGVGIPDLLVVVFDIDPGTRPEEVIGSSSASNTVAPPSAVGQDFPADRLGSVLTDQDGAFELTYEDDAFRIRNPEEKRPDLFLAVLAPEETTSDFSSRVLFSSAGVRQNAGRSEQALILLTTEQLEKAGIPVPSSPSPILEDPAEVIAKLVKSHENEVQLRTGHREINVRRVERIRAHTRKFEEQLKPQLLKALSNVPEELATSDTYVAPNESVTDKNIRTIRRDIEKVINVDDPKVRAPIVGRIRLSDEQIEKLRDQGFEDEHGNFVNVPDEVIEPIFYGSADTHERKTFLLRDDPLIRLCRDKTSGEKCMDGEEEQPVEPIDGDNSEENAEDTPSVVAAPGTGIEVATDEDIPRFIARLTNHLTAPEEAVNFGVVETGKRADQDDVQRRIDALSFRRGPADVPAFYDFHNLQIAFEHVWQEAIDQGVIDLAEDAYKHLVELGGDPCDPSTDPGAVVDCYRHEADNIIQGLLEEPYPHVVAAFDVTREQWMVLNGTLREELGKLAEKLVPGVKYKIGATTLVLTPDKLTAASRTFLREQGERILKYADEESGSFAKVIRVAKCCLIRGKRRYRAATPSWEHDFQAMGETDPRVLFDLSARDPFPRAGATRGAGSDGALSRVVDHVDWGARG